MPQSALRHIYINGRFLSQRTTGVQRYARETLAALDKIVDRSSGVIWTVLVPQGAKDTGRWENLQARRVGRLAGHAWEQIELPLYARGGLLLTLSGAPSVLHPQQLFVIHDMAIYDVAAGYSLPYRILYRSLYRASVNRAKVIFTVSFFSKGRISKLFPKVVDRIVVTYAAVDHFLPKNNPDVSVPKFQLPSQPYILAVGSLGPNKNFKLILKLAQLLEDVDVRIVVVGASNPKVFATEEALSSHITWLGYVADEELRELYRNAACFVFPSIYEGFGLPPLEAMQCGCPVVASNAASIPEVCGDAALYFDPGSEQDLSRQVLKILDCSDLRDELKKKGLLQVQHFTWTKVAATIKDAVSAVVRENSSSE